MTSRSRPARDASSLLSSVPSAFWLALLKRCEEGAVFLRVETAVSIRIGCLHHRPAETAIHFVRLKAAVAIRVQRIEQPPTSCLSFAFFENMVAVRIEGHQGSPIANFDVAISIRARAILKESGFHWPNDERPITTTRRSELPR